MDNPEDDFLGGYQPPPEGALKELGIGTFQGASLDIPGGLTDIAPFASYLLNRNPAMVEVMAPHYQATVEEYGSDALAETFLPPVEEGLESYREAGRLAGGVAGLGEMLTAKVSKILGRQISKILKNRDGVLVAVTPEGDQIPVPNEALDAPDTSVMQMADEGGDAPAQGDLFDQSRLDPDDPRVLPTDLDAFLAASAQRRDAELADLQKAFREGYKPGPRRTNTPLTVSELNMLRAMRAGKGGARGLLHGIRGAKSKVYIDQDKVENLLDPAYKGRAGYAMTGQPAIFPEEVNLYGGPFDVHGFQPVGSMDVTIKDLILSGGMSQRSKQILAETDAAKSAEGGRPGFSVSRDPLISVKGFTDQGDATDTFNVSSLEDTVIVIPSVQLRREDFFGNRLDRDDVESFSAGDILESDLEALSPSQYMLKAYDPDKSIQLKPNTEFNEDELHLGSGQGFGTPAGAIVRNLTDREKEDLARYSNRIAIQRNNLKKIKSLNNEDSAFTNIASPDRMNYNTLGFGNPDLVTKGVKELEEELVILGTMEAESPLMLNLTRDRFITALGPKIEIGLQSPEFRAAWAAKHGNEGLAALEEIGRKAGVLDPRNRESRPSISNRKQALEDAAKNFHADLINQEINQKLDLPGRGFTIEFQHGGEGKYERTLKLYPTADTLTPDEKAVMDRYQAVAREPGNLSKDYADFVTTSSGDKIPLPKMNQGYDLQQALIEALRTNSEGLYGEAARRLSPENRDLGVMMLDGIRRVEKRYVTEVDKLPEAQSFNAIYRNNKYLLQSAIETAGNAFPATGTTRVKLDPDLDAALTALKVAKKEEMYRSPEGTKRYARDIVAKREARMRPAGTQLYAEGGIVSMIPKVVNNYHAGGYVHAHREGSPVPDLEIGDFIAPKIFENFPYTPAEEVDGFRVPSPAELQTGVIIDDFRPAIPKTPIDTTGDNRVDAFIMASPSDPIDSYTPSQQELIDKKKAAILADNEFVQDMLALEGKETFGLMQSAFEMDELREQQALENLGITSMIPQILDQDRNLFTQMPAILSEFTAQYETDNYGLYFPSRDKIINSETNIEETIRRGLPFKNQMTNMHELMHAGLQKRIADMVQRRPGYFTNLPKITGPGLFSARDLVKFAPDRQARVVDQNYAMLNVPLELRERYSDVYSEYIQAVRQRNQTKAPVDEAIADVMRERTDEAFEYLIKPYLTAVGGEEEYSLGHSLIAVPTVTRFLPQALRQGTTVDQAFSTTLLRDYAQRYLPQAHFFDVRASLIRDGIPEKYPIIKHFFKYGHLSGVIPEGKAIGEPGDDIIYPEGFDSLKRTSRPHAGKILTRLINGNLHYSNKDMSTINYHAGGENLAPFVKQIRDFNAESIDYILDKHRSLTSRYAEDILVPGMSGPQVTPEDIFVEDLGLETQADDIADAKRSERIEDFFSR